MTDYESAFWKLKNNWHESVKHYEERIEKLETALDDALQYVSSADWHYLKDETRKTLEENDG